MRRVVVYDANVLFPAGLRDILLQIALNDLVRAHFSPRILDEVLRNLSTRYPDVSRDTWERLERDMITVRPGICMECDESLAAEFKLPDPADQHVLALAIQTRGQTIVTENTSDFPARVLEPLGIRSLTADEFLFEVASINRAQTVASLKAVSGRLVNPPRSEREILSRAGLEMTLQELAEDLPR